MKDIKNYDTFSKVELIEKGWSSDKKYYIETNDNKHLLLRISDISEFNRKKEEFELMKMFDSVNIPMSKPIDLGVCNDGKSVYGLFSWCEGVDAEIILPTLSEKEQYDIGVEAGKILKKINNVVVSENSNWLDIYTKKIDYYINNYKNCGFAFEKENLIIDFINENKYLMRNRPMCMTHGDFHVGNLILSDNKELAVIDFNRFKMVDPHHSFGAIVFSAIASPLFATGQINGYFENNPPIEFWKLLKLYLSAIAINSLPWSVPYGDKEIEFAYQQINDILSWYNDMTLTIPKWYHNPK